MEQINMELKDKLRELRGSISQRQCAENLGVKFANYNKWENGINVPNYQTLIQIADYYGVSLDCLTGRTDLKNVEYQQEAIDIGLTENAILRIRAMSPESRNILEQIIKELTNDRATVRQKMCLLQAVKEMSIEDIALLCELAKRMPRKEELKR